MDGKFKTMNQKLFIVILCASLSGCVFIEGCQNRKSNALNDTDCKMFDTLLQKHNHDGDYLNKKISELEKKTGIESKADKGLLGYFYKTEEAFYSDMNKYRLALGCK